MLKFDNDGTLELWKIDKTKSYPNKKCPVKDVLGAVWVTLGFFFWRKGFLQKLKRVWVIIVVL